MEIKKMIALTESEVIEAISEYLAKRDIAYNIESIFLYDKANENDILVQVVSL